MRTAVLLVLLALAAPAAAQEWPMWRHDAARTGRSPDAALFGTPAEAFALQVGGKLEPSELLVDDLDLDGLPDTVFARGGRLLSVRQDGSLGWASPDARAWWPYGAADLDGDGRPETAIATATPGVAFLDGTRGRILFATDDGEIPALGTVLPLDVEGDGTVELYVSDDGCSLGGRGTGRVYDFDGGTAVRTALRTETHDTWCGRDHVLADLDGDGRPEIVAPDDDRIWAYDPVSGFSAFASDSLGGFPFGLVHSSAADLDGDGDDELILASDNPWRWYASARRLQVLDAEGEDLVSRWRVLVDPGSGAHRYLDSPAADVVASSPGLEVVSSIAAGATTGWEVRVYRGLPEGTDAQVVATIPGAVALGLADLDGDGLAEIVTRAAPSYVVDDGPALLTVYDVLDDGSYAVLWTTSDPAELPLLPGPAGSASVVPPAGRNGWGAPLAPVTLEAAGGITELLLAVDADGDDTCERLALVDGPTGVERESWTSADPTLDNTGRPGLLRASGGETILAGATDDGHVAHFDPTLAVTDDADGDTVFDVLAANRMPVPPIVPTAGPLVAADPGARVVAFDAACADPICRPAARSSLRLAGGYEARVAEANAEGAAPLLVGGATDANGAAAVVTFTSVDGFAPTLIFARSGFEPDLDALPAGPLDPAAPAWDAVALPLYEPEENRSALALVSSGGGTVLWAGLDADGPVRGPLCAADVDGDGTNELLVVRDGFLQIISAAGDELARVDSPGGGMISALDVDGDGNPDLFRTGADRFAAERLNHSLTRLWVADDGTSHRDRLGATAQGHDGTRRIITVAGNSAELVAWAAEDGAELWRITLAAGRGWANPTDVYAAGEIPGNLGSPIAAAGPPGGGGDTVVVGSSDGFLYGVSADDGSLSWAVPLHAPVGEPSIGTPAGTSETRIFAPTLDGLLHVVGFTSLAAPAEVWDGDGSTDPASAADDIDETGDSSVAAAAWPAVEGADAYDVQLVTESGVTVLPWRRVTEPRFVARDLALRPRERYRAVVRAVSGAAFSPETASDGFQVIDDDAPWVEVTARPDRILPDVDGIDDWSIVSATLSDGVLIYRWRAEVWDDAGAVVLELGREETGRADLTASVRWDGRGADDRVVAGGPWRVAFVAEDSAGHEGRGEAVVWVCTGAALAEPACAPRDADAGTEDTGPDAEEDAGPDSADGGPYVPGGGAGCSCRTSGSGSSTGLPFLGLALAFLLLRRRPPAIVLLALGLLALSCSSPPPRNPQGTERRLDVGASQDAGATEPNEDDADTALPPFFPPVAPDAAAEPATTADAATGPADAATASADAATPRPDAAPDTAPATGATVVARLGCSTITAAEVEREMRYLRVLAGIGGGELTAEQEASLRQAAVDRISLELVVRREAEARGLTVTTAELLTAAAMVARGNGVEVDALYRAVEERGMSRDEYDEDLEFQLLEFKVIQAHVADEPVEVSEEEIAAEYRARTEGLSADVVRPLADVRDVLREDLAADKTEIQGRAWLARRREELLHAEPVRTASGCVERPASPESP